jgi:hypothetical protein
MARSFLALTLFFTTLSFFGGGLACAADQAQDGGVGMVLNINNASLYIIGVLANSPAERAGLHLEDKIVNIDGQPPDTRTVGGNIGRIRGPIGSDVVITISRSGEPKPQDYTLRRESIHVTPNEPTAVSADAQDFEVGKYGSWDGKTSAPGYYEITDFEKVQDVAGIQHVVCGGTSITARDGLTQRLSKAFGNDDDAENKIVAYIKKVDTGKNGPKRCPKSAAAPVETPQRFDAERVYASFVPFVFDFRRGMDVEQGEPFSHEFKFTFYKTRTDLQGHKFFVHENDGTMSREKLRAQQAELDKKIRSPLTNFDQNMVRIWKHDLAPVQTYLAKIAAVESDPARAAYLESQSTMTMVAERDSDDTVDCDVMGRVGKCPRSSLPESFQAITESRGMLTGTVANHGDRMIVRLEAEVIFLSKSGKEVARRLYALPIDESIGNLTERLPEEIFYLGPNSSKEFHIKVLHMIPEWSGAIAAKLTGVTFSDDYVGVLRKIRNDDEAAVQQWIKQGRDDQAAAYQRMISEIDLRLNAIAGYK